MCKDVEGVAGRMVDHHETMHFVLQQQLDGFEEARIRVNGDDWSIVVM